MVLNNLFLVILWLYCFIILRRIVLDNRLLFELKVRVFKKYFFSWIDRFRF